MTNWLKSTHCSCSGPDFDPEHQDLTSQLCVTQVLGYLVSSLLVSLGTRHYAVHRHIFRNHMHTHTLALLSIAMKICKTTTEKN